jgi:hypothetical protein
MTIELLQAEDNYDHMVKRYRMRNTINLVLSVAALMQH